MIDLPGAVATSSTHLASQPAAEAAPADSTRETPAAVGQTEAPKKTSINISAHGRSKLDEEQKKQRADTSDIDNSGLDDQTKNILKKIRELEQKIQDKVQELQQVMSDKSLSDKAREQKLAVVRTELASLQGALNEATQALNESLAAARATSDQREQAYGLMHP